MTRYVYRTKVIALFEHVGDNAEAQMWALERLEPVGDIQSIDINKWIDPYRNEATVMERAEGRLHKFTLNAEMTFIVEGGYADAQKRIVDALQKDRETSHINIQSVKLTRSEMR